MLKQEGRFRKQEATVRKQEATLRKQEGRFWMLEATVRMVVPYFA